MYTNIVWATDGSEHANRALRYAGRIAQRDGATLHVAHVVEKLVGARVGAQNANLDEAAVDAHIRQQVDAIAAQYGIAVKLHVTAGRAGEVPQRIVDVARESGADLIVLGTRGHTAVVGAMIGSVTQRLLHLAPCAVLAVPPGSAEPGDADPAGTQPAAAGSAR